MRQIAMGSQDSQWSISALWFHILEWKMYQPSILAADVRSYQFKWISARPIFRGWLVHAWIYLIPQNYSVMNSKPFCDSIASVCQWCDVAASKIGYCCKYLNMSYCKSLFWQKKLLLWSKWRIILWRLKRIRAIVCYLCTIVYPLAPSYHGEERRKNKTGLPFQDQT